MKIRTLKDIPELKGKKVLLRVDYNVPLTDEGEVQDDTRIVQSLDTIRYLQEKGARIILVSHLGRPKGEIKEEFRLTKVAQYLSKLIDIPVQKADSVLGCAVEEIVNNLKDGEIAMLENIRFEPGEKKCDPDFCKKLADLADIYVSDAFGAAHRKHASTAGVAAHLPAYAGFLMEREIKALSPILNGEIKKPLTMIFGGAKIDTKIGVIQNFLDKADYFLMGGGLANTFLHAAGFNVAESLCEKDKLEIAQDIMMECEKNEEKFVLPTDVVVASEIKEGAVSLDLPRADVMGDMKILDIGRLSAENFKEIISKSGTVIWNGPLGLYEMSPYEQGSKIVAEAIANSDCTSILGGGDTIDCIKRLNIPQDSYTHISTGGGACVEFLSGEKLPGIEILKIKN
jgi:phosphoglycerate kinase